MVLPVLVLVAVYLDVPANPEMLVFRVLSSEERVAKAEMAVLRVSILPCRSSFCGAVSAWTRLSTIWVILSPDPLEFSALR